MDGGGTPRIEGCLIHHNAAVGPGGGIAVEGGAFPVIAGCVVVGNEGGDGGGLYLGAAGARIEFCVIEDNTSPFGAGISMTSCEDVRMSSVLITGNQAAIWGGAVSAASGLLRMDRVTVARNAGEGGTFTLWDCTAALTECILEGNDAESAFRLEGSSQVAIGYCDIWDDVDQVIEGAPPPGFGVVAFVNGNGDSCDAYRNLFMDPLFTDPGNGDFHLDPSSPCIDAGDPTSEADPDGSTADMGAYPATARLVLEARHIGETVHLSWSSCPGAHQFWVFGAANDAYFMPGAAPTFLHRLAVLPGEARTWSTTDGMGDAQHEWTFQVAAVEASGWELARSGRAGEREQPLAVRR